MKQRLTWETRRNLLSNQEIYRLRDIALLSKKLIQKKRNDEKELGSPFYWKALDMASRDEILNESVRGYLHQFIRDQRFTNIASQYLDDVYLFNDQFVTKLKNESFNFSRHTDNQFNIGKEYEGLTLTFVLDDFTELNGPIQVEDVTDNKWTTLLPKRGDVIVMNHNTPHRSSNNQTKESRSVYIIHYTNGFCDARFHQELLK